MNGGTAEWDGGDVAESGYRRKVDVLTWTSALRKPLFALFAGLLLTLSQVGFAMRLSDAVDDSLRGRYLSLFQHDSFWMEDIARRGYQSPVPPVPYKHYQESNVAFFPGYPLLSRAVAALGGDRSSPDHLRYAMLLTAQLSAWLFWCYIVLFFQRWKVPGWIGVPGLALLASHPAAFFLVAPYSESTFLASLLGFIYWSSTSGSLSKWVAAIHGLGMTATRIVGIPCAVANLLCGEGPDAAGTRRSWKQWALAVLVSLFSLGGAIAFFAFCQVHFRSWDFYMQTQKAGWGVQAEYLAPFKWETYKHFSADWDVPINLSQLSVAVTPWIFLVLGLAELLVGRKTWRERLPFYFAGLVIFYISVAGVASVQLESMIRYQFCTHVFVVLALVQLLSRHGGKNVNTVAVLVWVSGFVAATLIYVQMHYLGQFTIGEWFA
jgi:hypothetical protein